jgi:hypothetical protein
MTTENNNFNKNIYTDSKNMFVNILEGYFKTNKVPVFEDNQVIRNIITTQNDLTQQEIADELFEELVLGNLNLQYVGL